MLSEDKLFKELSQAETWQRYCGFLDLSTSDFMDIQKELLMDHLDRVANSALAKKIMGDKPSSIDEFRRKVPLTNHEDYEPYLGECQEDALAIKPRIWCHSAGRGGRFKWYPYSSEAIERVVNHALGCIILASTDRKGVVNVSPGYRSLLLLPPPPYSSGVTFQVLGDHFSLHRIPPPEMSEGLPFQEKVRKGFELALKDGVDMIVGIASMLVKMGEQFGQGGNRKFSLSMLHPNILSRFVKAKIRSKKEGRSILPKDLWPTKAILTGGMDTAIYKDDIAYYWGCDPYEVYACAEIIFVAAQAWNRKSMVFFPDLAFFEFIPQEKPNHEPRAPEHQQATVLLDELEEGKLYEVVITQFHGMPLMRYRMNDIIRVIGLRDDEAGIKLPQIIFQRRSGETIDLAALAQLDEKTIWQAISKTGITYVDWSACKEYDKNQTFLRVFIEPKEKIEANQLEHLLDAELKKIDVDYRDLDKYLNLQPVRVTILSTGTFQRYAEEKIREGADPAHLKPMHINPEESDIKRLLELSVTGK